ncbi:Protein-arginine deiminase (PAD) [Nonomuraea solani]|uniref:Protein-arginine deiminase (PAD) n=1 Tax=Nonomuraea solani TaxID=1144553 RepID=A0A1H6F1N9_9ACTN|nr:protein-arginine deiminase family protein [Nonomuraea solani]SEH03271.1 Protein-arginine deiminase (PAD) [Nonomuraea solani]
MQIRPSPVPPGRAIVLANLNLDRGIPAGDRSLALDSRDDEINGADDLKDLTRLPRPAANGEVTPDSTFVALLDGGDRNRVRLFGPVGSDGKWQRVLGASVNPRRIATEYTAAYPGPDELLIESLTLPGAPVFDPADRNGKEIRLEWGYRVPGVGDVLEPRVVTIAPLLLPSNLEPVDRVYMTCLYDYDVTFNHPTLAEVIAALREVLGPDRVPVNTRPEPDGGVRYLPHDPFDPDAIGGLYLIDGHYFSDPWTQDEVKIGYCLLPGPRHTQVALHNPRGRDLGPWVSRLLPGKELGLFNDLDQVADDSISYGGNLEVSPPVEIETPPAPSGPAGPEIADPPRAPFGKIILGRGEVLAFTEVVPPEAADLEQELSGELGVPGWLFDLFEKYDFDLDRDVTSVGNTRPGERWRVVDAPIVDYGPRVFEIRRRDGLLDVYLLRLHAPGYRSFLEAQGVQPILPLDVSWLAVGHVDEFVTVVPSRAVDADAPRRDFRVVTASPQVAVDLLLAAKAYEPTDLFRGRQEIYSDDETGDLSLTDARRSVADVLGIHQEFNENLHRQKMLLIEERLRTQLDLGEGRLLRLPVLFAKPPGMAAGTLGLILHKETFNWTTAYTPNLVNLVVLDDLVLLPRPLGPRLRPREVNLILARQLGMELSAEQLARLAGEPHWARRGALVNDIAAIFGVSIGAVRNHPANNPMGQSVFGSDGRTYRQWERVWIPEKSIDLFEAYACCALERLSLRVRFVEDWDAYHMGLGELHCGINVQRTPREIDPGYQGPYWWET